MVEDVKKTESPLSRIEGELENLIEKSSEILIYAADTESILRTGEVIRPEETLQSCDKKQEISRTRFDDISKRIETVLLKISSTYDRLVEIRNSIE